ncbi:hypothetical protein As57867_005167, partial [Aphanomyces stellatus]
MDLLEAVSPIYSRASLSSVFDLDWLRRHLNSIAQIDWAWLPDASNILPLPLDE